MRILSHYWSHIIPIPFFYFYSPVQKEVERIRAMPSRFLDYISYYIQKTDLKKYLILVACYNYYRTIPLQKPLLWKKLLFEKFKYYSIRLGGADMYKELFFFQFFEYMIIDKPEFEKEIVKLILKKTNIVEITENRIPPHIYTTHSIRSPETIDQVVDIFQMNLDYEGEFFEPVMDVLELCIEFPFFMKEWNFMELAGLLGGDEEDLYLKKIYEKLKEQNLDLLFDSDYAFW